MTLEFKKLVIASTVCISQMLRAVMKTVLKTPLSLHKRFKATGRGDIRLGPLKALPNHEPRHLQQNKYSMDDAILYPPPEAQT